MKNPKKKYSTFYVNISIVNFTYAMFNAASTVFSLSSKIFETKPISNASWASNFLAERANSLAIESFPIIFGNLCSVPKSAANPTSTSLIVNQESAEVYRISQADNKSRAPPIDPPWEAAITGFGQSEIVN